MRDTTRTDLPKGRAREAWRSHLGHPYARERQKSLKSERSERSCDSGSAHPMNRVRYQWIDGPV